MVNGGAHAAVAAEHNVRESHNPPVGISGWRRSAQSSRQRMLVGMRIERTQDYKGTRCGSADTCPAMNQEWCLPVPLLGELDELGHMVFTWNNETIARFGDIVH